MKRKLTNESPSDSASQGMAKKLLRLLTYAERVHAIDPRIAQLAIFVEPADQGSSSPFIVIDGNSTALPQALPYIMREQELILCPPPPATTTPSTTATAAEVRPVAVDEDQSGNVFAQSSSLTAEQRRIIEENRRLAKERLEARRRSSEGQPPSQLPTTLSKTLVLPSVSVNTSSSSQTSHFVAKTDVCGDQIVLTVTDGGTSGVSSLDVGCPSEYLPLPNIRPVPISAAVELEVSTQSGDSFVYMDSQMTTTVSLEAKKESADLLTDNAKIVVPINYCTNSSSSRRLCFKSFPEPLKMFCSIYRWSSTSAVPMTDTDIGTCAMNVSPICTEQSLPCDRISHDEVHETRQPCIIYWPTSVFRRSGNRALALVEHLSQATKSPIIAILTVDAKAEEDLTKLTDRHRQSMDESTTKNRNMINSNDLSFMRKNLYRLSAQSSFVATLESMATVVGLKVRESNSVVEGSKDTYQTDLQNSIDAKCILDLVTAIMTETSRTVSVIVTDFSGHPIHDKVCCLLSDSLPIDVSLVAVDSNPILGHLTQSKVRIKEAPPSEKFTTFCEMYESRCLQNETLITTQDIAVPSTKSIMQIEFSLEIDRSRLFSRDGISPDVVIVDWIRIRAALFYYISCTPKGSQHSILWSEAIAEEEFQKAVIVNSSCNNNDNIFCSCSLHGLLGIVKAGVLNMNLILKEFVNRKKEDMSFRRWRSFFVEFFADQYAEFESRCEFIHAKYSCQLEQSKTLNVPWFILLKYSSREQDLCSLDALEEYRHRFVSKFGAIYLTPQDLRAAQSGDAIFDTAQSILLHYGHEPRGTLMIYWLLTLLLSLSSVVDGLYTAVIELAIHSIRSADICSALLPHAMMKVRELSELALIKNALDADNAEFNIFEDLKESLISQAGGQHSFDALVSIYKVASTDLEGIVKTA